MLPRLLLAAVAAWVLAAAPAQAIVDLPDPIPPVAANPADDFLGTAIEAFGYDAATKCSKRKRPGMARFVGWLTDNAEGESWGTYRCEKWGKSSASLHAEGRALDWRLDVADKAERKEVERLVLLLLAPDAEGEQQALARRMGVEEIIWDCGYWASGMTAFKKYSACFDAKGKRRKDVDKTVAHRDHVHFGLTKKGAAGRTSFWRG